MSVIEEMKKDIKNVFQVQDRKALIKANIPYLTFFYLGDIFAHHVNSYVGGDVIDRIFQAIMDTETMRYGFSIDPKDMLGGLIFAGIVKLIVYSKGRNAKKFRKGEEYGSACWGTHKDIAPYMDDEFRNNLLLTETERITMNSRQKNPKYARNKNVLVVGGSDSSKTRFFVKPNLMQMHSSYVVTDPKGSARRSHFKRVGMAQI